MHFCHVNANGFVFAGNCRYRHLPENRSFKFFKVRVDFLTHFQALGIGHLRQDLGNVHASWHLCEIKGEVIPQKLPGLFRFVLDEIKSLCDDQRFSHERFKVRYVVLAFTRFEEIHRFRFKHWVFGEILTGFRAISFHQCISLSNLSLFFRCHQPQNLVQCRLAHHFRNAMFDTILLDARVHNL